MKGFHLALLDHLLHSLPDLIIVGPLLPPEGRHVELEARQQRCLVAAILCHLHRGCTARHSPSPCLALLRDADGNLALGASCFKANVTIHARSALYSVRARDGLLIGHRPPARESCRLLIGRAALQARLGYLLRQYIPRHLCQGPQLWNCYRGGNSF